MGRDKARLVRHPDDPARTTLAQWLAAALAAVADPVLEVGRGCSGLAAVPDDNPGDGPLAALATGVRALGLLVPTSDRATSAPSAVLVLACDLPLVDAGLLAWLAAHPATGSIVPLTADPPRAQPLCARWTVTALAGVPALVAAGERSMRPLVAGPDVTLLSPDAWSGAAGAAGPDALDDADTPVDLARVRSHPALRPPGATRVARPAPGVARAREP